MPFDALMDGIENEVDQGFVNVNTCNETGLQIYCYSKATTFSKAWNDYTLISRGLIVSSTGKSIVGRPFPKFFNYGELIGTGQGVSQFTEKFEVFEKMDGSLIILFFYAGKWRTATKGSFTSDQALWAANYIKYMDTESLVKGDTYLLEATYPANKIVIPYPDERLTMLAAYKADGEEYSYEDLRYTAIEAGFHCVVKYDFKDLHDLVEQTKKLPFTQEGFVIRFENGYRIKLKGDEYCRLHRAISRLTPLCVWELMLNADDLQLYKSELPEEFWKDFETMVYLINIKLAEVLQRITALHEQYKHVADRDLMGTFKGSKLDLGLLFTFRKSKGIPDFMRKVVGKTNELLPSARKTIFELVKPKANVLEGYQPSTALNHFEEESL